MTLKMKYSFENIANTITLILLLLAGINVYNKYYYFCLVASAIFIVSQKKLTFDWNCVSLLILGVSWIVFSPYSDDLKLTTMIKPVLYLLVYIIGRNFYNKERNDATISERKIINIVGLISFAPFIHYLINFFNNRNSVLRNTIDVWTKQALAATGQAVLACMMMAVCIAILFMQQKRLIKIFAVCCLSIIMLYNLVLSGRTLLVLLVMIMLICTIYVLILNPVKTKRFVVLLSILTVIFLGYIIVVNNVFGILDMIENSNLFLRFFGFGSMEDVFSSGRLERKTMFLKEFGNHLLGGNKIRYSGVGYAHDLYLDTYDEAGIFALVAVVAFVIRAIWVMSAITRNGEFGFNMRIMIVAFYSAVLIVSFIEPILQGVPWFFTLFCFIHGIIESVYSRNCRMHRL